jgi:hypothetical protein
LAAAREIESASHLFDATTSRRYDTALERYDLKASARALRDAAGRLDEIAGRIPDRSAYAEAAE